LDRVKFFAIHAFKTRQVKHVLKAMNQEEAAFSYLREKFPKQSVAKLTENIFIGPQLREHYQGRILRKVISTR